MNFIRELRGRKMERKGIFIGKMECVVRMVMRNKFLLRSPGIRLMEGKWICELCDF